MVLMAALTTGSGAPDCWHSHSHAYVAGCYGGGVAPNCSGVYGGSYYGIPCGGYGCSGSWGGYGCNGCWGCYGGSWGNGWGGGGLDYNCFGCHGCYGCYGGFGCVGYSPGGPAASIPESIPAPHVDEKKGGTSTVTPSRAKVIVQLPADAKLFVDDQPVKATQERQSFSTPQLRRGQTYFYDVRAEAIRDGKTVVETKRIIIRAGEEVTVSFPKLAPPTAEVAATDGSRR
jgi:uncharacterized protein (TIGR03000 family)